MPVRVMDLPEDEALRAWVPNYPIRVIELGGLPLAEVEKFKSDFKLIAKYTHSKYNKGVKFEDLIGADGPLNHPKETLRALAALSGDERYLQIGLAEGGVTMGCEVVERLHAQGMDCFAELMKILFANNRVEDARRATEDAAYRDRLLEEYGIK